MQFKFFMAAVAATLSLVIFQQCSVGGAEGGVGDLSSAGPNGPTTPPTMSFDQNSAVLQQAATTFRLDGGCNIGIYTSYVFDVSYLQSGATSAYSKRVSASCASGRFTLNLATGDFQMNPNLTGVLSGRITAIRSSGELEGPQARVNISFAATTGTSTSGTTTSGTTTSGTTTGTTTQPPCVPDCSAGKFAQFNYCQSVPDGCGSFCPGTGSIASNCPAANTYCGARTDQCGNACATGTNCCPGPGRCKGGNTGSCNWDVCDNGPDQCVCSH